MKKIKAAIIGTGNIGTDLLIKILKSDFIEIVSFVGRRKESKGVQTAMKLGVPVSVLGIDYFLQNEKCCDVVYDCTDSDSAKKHAVIFAKQGIKVVDLTPSKVGKMCIPSVNPLALKDHDNINMITCGGQATLPLVDVISKHCSELEYVELVSQIASKSAGMGTRINIDSYIHTTEKAIKHFTKSNNCKVILNLNPAEPCVDMQTTIFIKSKNVDFQNMSADLYQRIREIKEYVPHYELIMPPVINEHDIMTLTVRVQGAGDYLPKYAGNLDIINCAAIEATKHLWKEYNEE